MKKKLTILSILAPIGLIATTPIIAASCGKKTQQKQTEKGNKIVNLTKSLEEYKEFSDSATVDKINKFVEEAKNLNENSKAEILDSFIERANEALINLKNLNTTELHGMKVFKIAFGQKNELASHVVKAIKSAKSWEAIKTVLKEHSIKIEEPKDKKIELNSTTHAHDEEGMIHLDLFIGEKKEKARFEIIGFKKQEAAVNIKNWKFHLHGLKGKKLPTQDELFKELKAAQGTNFETLLNKLKEYIEITTIDESNKDMEFKINFEDTEHTKIHEKDLLLQIQVYNKSQPDTILETKNIEIEFGHHHHHDGDR